ncbi:MAG: DUF2723 domain-containing protein [Chloroflexi bacterium]|nr:DUF2723 domain-containing protein [Chloroflexota bacterium]
MMPPLSRVRLHRWLPDLIVIGAPLIVYVLTLAPTIFAVDSAELTTGAYTLGLIHPTGYPTYLALGHLFIQLPLGATDPGWRLNLMSAVTSALTAWLAYRITRRFVTHPATAVLSALIGALSFYVWGESNVAEVYSLNWLLVLAGFWLLLNWIESGRDRWLYACAFIGGLSLTHHLSAGLAFPGYAVLIVFNGRRRLAWRALPAAALLFGLGLTPYLYLPLRYAAEPGLDYARKYLQADLSTPAGVLWYISGGTFQSLLRLGPIEAQLSEAWSFLKYVLYNYLVIGCALSAAGAIGLWRRPSGREHRSFLAATAIAFAATAVFYFNYEVFDKYTMYGVCLWLMAIWIGPGLELLARCISRRVSYGLALGLLALQLIVFYPQSDMSRFASIRDRQLSELTQLPDRAVYFGDWETVVVSEYLQIVEQQRPDVLVLNLPYMVPAQREVYAAQLAESDRPLCFSRVLADQAGADGAVVTLSGEDCYQLRWP